MGSARGLPEIGYEGLYDPEDLVDTERELGGDGLDRPGQGNASARFRNHRPGRGLPGFGGNMDLGPDHVHIIDRSGQTFRDDEARPQLLQMARTGHKPDQFPAVEPQAVGPLHADLAGHAREALALKALRLNFDGTPLRFHIHVWFNTMKSR